MPADAMDWMKWHWHPIAATILITAILALLFLPAGNSRSGAPLPTLAYQHNDTVIHGVEGSYCWTFPDSQGTCRDKLGPRALTRNVAPQHLPHNATIHFVTQGHTPPDPYRYRLQYVNGTDAAQGTTTSGIRLAVTLDEYVLTVSGNWDAGDLSYAFPITVEPRDQ